MRVGGTVSDTILISELVLMSDTAFSLLAKHYGPNFGVCRECGFVDTVSGGLCDDCFHKQMKEAVENATYIKDSPLADLLRC